MPTNVQKEDPKSTFPVSVDELSKKDANLLVFLEARMTDYGGRVKDALMNEEDWYKVHIWAESGFIERKGRIAYIDHNGDGTAYIWLCPSAISLAYEARLARLKRAMENRRYKTTEEARTGKTVTPEIIDGVPDEEHQDASV